jgi:hypothetical protein
MDLGLVGTAMYAIKFSDSVCLYFSDGHELSLDAPFTISTGEGTFTAADADDASAFFAIVDLAIGAVVTAASADDVGTLRVDFSDGCVITAESWKAATE